MVSLTLSQPRALRTDDHEALSRHLSLDELWQRAFDRASQMRRNTRYEGPDHYTILSERFSFRYDLVRYGTDWRCNCPAGQAGQPCKHRAKLEMRLQREGKAWHLFDEGDSGGDLFDGDLDEPQTIESLAERQRKFLKDNQGDWVDVDLPSRIDATPAPAPAPKADPFAAYKEAMGAEDYGRRERVKEEW